MRLCARIILHIIGDLLQDWAQCAQFSNLHIIRLFRVQNFAVQRHKYDQLQPVLTLSAPFQSIISYNQLAPL